MAEHEITSPLPGVFYRRPAPDKDPYLKEGDSVESGATIGLIEVMKTFNEVESDVSGTLVKYLVENEESVESGQALATVETDD